MELKFKIYDVVFGDKIKWSENILVDERVANVRKTLEELNDFLNSQFPDGVADVTVNSTYKELQLISGYGVISKTPKIKQEDDSVRILTDTMINSAMLKIYELLSDSGLRLTMYFEPRNERLTVKIQNPLMSDGDWRVMHGIDEIIGDKF